MTVKGSRRLGAVGVDVWWLTINGSDWRRTERSTLFRPLVCGVRPVTDFTVARGGLGEALGENWYLCSIVVDGHWCVCRRKRHLLVDRASIDVPTETAQGTPRPYSKNVWTSTDPSFYDASTRGSRKWWTFPGNGARVTASGGRRRHTPRPSPGLVS
jgi:hypothetical protein